MMTKTKETAEEIPYQRLTKVYYGNAAHQNIVIGLPKTLTTKYGIDKPAYVMVEDAGNGILIRKVNVKMEYDKQ